MSESEIPKVITPNELKKAIEEYLKDMNSEVLIFIHENPTILRVTKYSSQKQMVIELMFSEENVPNPHKLKEKLGYVA